ncbi:DUF6266 family protein [Pedobacter faecalis]|uniref:DUF6266 family protein n=1 Tax=Pedobacter faecalis TaxID=3041495 RepID=UPI002550BAC4|nr:DUF6266 family protein [Pedobacter sp. ELA7]
MAKLINGLLGGLKGKIGPAVGYYLNNEPHIRALPRPKRYTAAERRNHEKFKMVQDHLLPIKDLLKVGFKNYYTKTGGYRAAVSYTRKVALISEAEGFYIDPTLLRFSGGNLPGALAPVMGFATGLNLRISWNTASLEWRYRYDQLMVLIYDLNDFKAIKIGLEGPFRNQGYYEVDLSNHFKGKAVHVYIGFVASDRSMQSNTQYLGVLEVPG